MQHDGNGPIGVNDGSLTSELGDFADDGDIAADVRLEILGVDTRGRGGFGHGEIGETVKWEVGSK